METDMSACGVLCSSCAAYKGRERGAAHQQTGAAAWLRIYGYKGRERGAAHQQTGAAAWLRVYGYRQDPAAIACGGCLSSDRDVFHTSRTCRARRCCRAKSLAHCGECGVERCAALEKAQSVWDGVPEIARSLSPADRAAYAAPTSVIASGSPGNAPLFGPETWLGAWSLRASSVAAALRRRRSREQRRDGQVR